MEKFLQVSPENQVDAIFRFIKGKPVAEFSLLKAVKEKDFKNIAYYYNGKGQVDRYKMLIRNAYDKFQKRGR